jgi:capsular polysaccharide transport system permease protein
MKKISSLLKLFKNILFMATVFLPTLIGGVYYAFVVSDVYISESRFVIRSPQRQQTSSVIGAIFSGTGFIRSQDDAFSVQDYVLSRDALRELNDKLAVKKAFSDTKIDFIARFPGLLKEDSFESLHEYYLKQITVNHKSASSIIELKVRAFTADQAHAINESLLMQSERLVNQINDRGRVDSIKFAQAEVGEAERKAKEAALALATYRNQRAVFDPERQSALQLQQVSKLQDELISAKMQLGQIRGLTPDNPQIPVLQKRVQALTQEIAAEMSKISGGGGNSFSNKAADFERLSLERAFADRQLASSMSSLENAKNESRRKAIYLERIVEPNKPDVSQEPRRLRNTAAILMLGLVVYGILSILLAGVKEHHDR